MISRAAFSVAIVLAVAFYLYPTFKARLQLGSVALPPIFAPDLTMYLNLSQITEVGDGRVINPYYRIPVPSDGAGYLKFRLAPGMFGSLNRLLGSRTWFALLLWNGVWWGLLAVATVWLFDRFLPVKSTAIVIIGLGVMMLFNFGVLKSLLLAWVHLPSLAGFTQLSLPFMRAFIPVIPCALLLAYLGLQMDVLQSRRPLPWVAMALLQLFALAVFPYATVMMAGLTAVSVAGKMIRLGIREFWRIPLAYGATCACLDFAFLWHSSLGFYDNRSSAIHFQPQLLTHLIGGNWFLLVALTVATFFAKPLSFEVRWPLAGLGLSNALLMLGDAVVPSTKILLSHHAAHFVHLTLATLTIFLMAAALKVLTQEPHTLRLVPGLLLALISLNGVFLVSGNYQHFVPENLEIVNLFRLQPDLSPSQADLLIARSTTVDDPCGWVVLLSPSPVLFCTDAEVMLTPQQNQDIHRFRQALYLYLTGEDSVSLQQALAAPDPAKLIWKLGYWAEAISPSMEERRQGIQAIQSDVIPRLARVENHDAEVVAFFRKFHRVVVVDSKMKSVFAETRLSTFLSLESERDIGDFVLLYYTPR